MGADAQAQGSVLQAIGYALFEELVYDPPTGIPLTISHLDHKMALATQTPNITNAFVEIIEGPPDSYNHGGKGMGEVFIGNATAVIINAIANAIGWWSDTMPVTPEKVLKALGKA
jgi:CO/xanthine dehydrogenase Mo-binding subunit